MSELLGRLRAAWYVLRGWSVMRGVSVSRGEVTMHRQKVALSGGSRIEHAEIYGFTGLPEMRGAGAGHNEAVAGGTRYSHDGPGGSWQPMP